jgi:hypothetical protein
MTRLKAANLAGKSGSPAPTRRLASHGSTGHWAVCEPLAERTGGEQCREPFVDLRPLSPTYTPYHRIGADLPSIAIE